MGKTIVNVTDLESGEVILITENDVEGDIDERLDDVYEGLDLAGWDVTDHRDHSGELLLEATIGKAYVSIEGRR